MKMKQLNGQLAKNDLENAEIFKTHFEKLYNNFETTTYDETVLEELTEIQEDTKLESTPTAKEIHNALTRMQYEKSPGPNGIPTEAYKQLEGTGFGEFVILIRNFWDNPNFNPNEWSKSGLSILPKKVTYQTQINGEG